MRHADGWRGWARSGSEVRNSGAVRRRRCREAFWTAVSHSRCWHDTLGTRPTRRVASNYSPSSTGGRWRDGLKTSSKISSAGRLALRRRSERRYQCGCRRPAGCWGQWIPCGTSTPGGRPRSSLPRATARLEPMAKTPSKSTPHRRGRLVQLGHWCLQQRNLNCATRSPRLALYLVFLPIY